MKEYKGHQRGTVRGQEKDQEKDQVERLVYDDVLKQKSKRRNHYELQKKDKTKEINKVMVKRMPQPDKHVNLMRSLYDLEEEYDEYDDFNELDLEEIDDDDDDSFDDEA
jgi:hypothetical protein